MKNDNEIINQYFTNGELSGNEVRRLYDLINDPWNFSSIENCCSMDSLALQIQSILIDHKVDIVFDYGCGIGAFSFALKKLWSDAKFIGIDYDIAIDRGRKYFDVFNDVVSLSKNQNEKYLISHQYDYETLDKELLFCFLNSAYYIFMDHPIDQRAGKIKELIISLTKGVKPKYIFAASTGMHYDPPYQACKLMGMSIISEIEIKLDNPNTDFRGILRGKIFT